MRPVGLTTEEAALVEALAVALHLLGVIHCAVARRALVASAPVWHCGAAGRRKGMMSGGVFEEERSLTLGGCGFIHSTGVKTDIILRGG